MNPTFAASRRRLLQALVLTGAGSQLQFNSALAQDAADVPDLPEFRRLIAANRILANENVVDAFGHVSLRDPRNPERFIMSRSRSPALVEMRDLMEFDLNGVALDPRGRTAYGERMIHAAIYGARPEVKSVVHHHAYAVLPFTVSGVPMQPVIHAAAIIGKDIPLWDIRADFGDTDMLVRTIEMGKNLASTLGNNTCLLMRGHGAVVVGEDIPQAVLTAIYLQVNAQVLLQARQLGEPVVLSEAEVLAATQAQFSALALPRAWEYYCQRAGIDPE